jgi:hypothetical protein
MSARKAHPDGDDWQRIDIELAGLKSRMGLYCILLHNGDRGRLAADIRPLIARIAELESERDRLTPTEVSEDALASCRASQRPAV